MTGESEVELVDYLVLSGRAAQQNPDQSSPDRFNSSGSVRPLGYLCGVG